MIIDPSELVECDRALSDKNAMPNDHFVRNPHLLLATQFDEYVAFGAKDITPPVFDWSVEGHWDDFSPKEQIFFRRPGGQWLWLYLADLDQFWFHSYETWSREAIEKPLWGELISNPNEHFRFVLDTGEFLTSLEHVIEAPTSSPKQILSPLLWTPDAQAAERTRLQEATQSILNAIWSEKVDLTSVHWKQLEEIVGELLRDQGMKIHMVTETPQGGRDVIAQGELLPNQEPLTLAVEVKQRAVVDRPQIQMALHQNRYFPALLFATAGRFSAGVMQEQALPENQLRLFLKDGVAIRDMIKMYGIRRGWHASPASESG